MPCVNAVSFREMPSAREICQLVRRAGFDAIELSRPHFYESFFSTTQRSALRALAEEFGLILSGFDCWVEVDPYQDAPSTLAEFDRAIEWAADLGIVTIISHDPWSHINGSRSAIECLRATAELFDQAVERVVNRSMSLVLEPHPDTLSMNNSWAIDIIDRLRERYGKHAVGLLYDCCHYGVGQPDSYVESIVTLGDRILHIHYSDGDQQTYARHLPLGEGSLDLAAVVRSLKSIGYCGTLTNDLYNCPDLERAAVHNAPLVAQIEQDLNLAGLSGPAQPGDAT